ncbi:hypothetical protein BC834DRAFT_213018 [Gloeopeniophorella convolvens]|nr:hypothetical protein BC834DRAFT_213018 [Gloeopeniophorella convolvens]
MPPSRRSSTAYLSQPASALDGANKPDATEGTYTPQETVVSPIATTPSGPSLDGQGAKSPQADPSEPVAPIVETDMELDAAAGAPSASHGPEQPDALEGASEASIPSLTAPVVSTSLVQASTDASKVPTVVSTEITSAPAERVAAPVVREPSNPAEPVSAPPDDRSPKSAQIKVEQSLSAEGTIKVDPQAPAYDQQPRFHVPPISRSGSTTSVKIISSTNTGGATSNTLTAPEAGTNKATSPQDKNITSTLSVTFPSSSPSNTSSTDDFDESTMISPRGPGSGRTSFSAVVHRNERPDAEKQQESRHSTASRSSTITSRQSTSSFKASTDGGVVRSKRNFKHLGSVPADPPASPGQGDLASLLQEAAWLEQHLADGNATFEMPSAPGEEGPKAEPKPVSSPTAVTKAEQPSRPAPAATTFTRSKARNLTLGPSTLSPTNAVPHSPIRSSTSTPSFQVIGPDDFAMPAPPPKSARTRKYFSLRGALRGPRLSMSSEMSSDDSAPVATPPSPTFDIGTPPAVHGQSNDTMSVRSMFSSRSIKSGKSESAPGSLRLSPRRGVARASSFAERLLSRATKTKSMLDSPEGTIPEQSPMLPPIIPETPGSLLSLTPSGSPDGTFDRGIFDAFPNVPSDIPQRPVSSMYPSQSKVAGAGEQNFRRSSTIGVGTPASTSEKSGLDKLGWLRSRQEAA